MKILPWKQKQKKPAAHLLHRGSITTTGASRVTTATSRLKYP